MKTRCKQCKKTIDFGKTYCTSCYSKNLKNKKKDIKNKYIESTTKSTTWKSLRMSVLRRDSGCCVLCFKRGYIEYRNLQVHHIVKRVDAPELIYETSNLVTLCRVCHEEVEKLSPTKQKKLLGNFNDEETHFLL